MEVLLSDFLILFFSGLVSVKAKLVHISAYMSPTQRCQQSVVQRAKIISTMAQLKFCLLSTTPLWLSIRKKQFLLITKRTFSSSHFHEQMAQV